MFTWTFVIPRSRSLWITCSVMPMFRIRIFIAGSEFLCSRKSFRPCFGAHLGGLGDPVEEPLPRLRVGRLERVVVALDPGPADHVRADLAGELGGLARQPPRLRARRGVGRDEPAPPEARVEVQAGADRVDPVPVERLAHLVEVLARELARVVELVVVDQPFEPFDGARARAVAVVSPARSGW